MKGYKNVGVFNTKCPTAGQNRKTDDRFFKNQQQANRDRLKRLMTAAAK